jgi:hypothetical protein
MPAIRIIRPIAGAVALTVTLGLGPALVATPRASGPAVSTHRAATGEARLRGTLVALRADRRTGDLAIAGGLLFPLRFASAQQERGLRVGAILSLSGTRHGYARILVRRLTVAGVARRVHIRGIVARALGRDAVEVLGVDGAAVVLRLGRARVTHLHPGAPSSVAAYADAGPALAPGQEVDAETTLAGSDEVDATTVSAVAPSVEALDIEGVVIAVGANAANPAAGTIAVRDEEGQVTTVLVGVGAASYRAGQDVEIYGVPTGADGSDATMRAQAAEQEDGAGDGQGQQDGQTGNDDGDAARAATPTPAPGQQDTATPTPAPTESDD